MTIPLQTADKRLVLVTLILIAACGLYVSVNYNAAFPQASLALPLTRDEITAKAEEFLRTRALSTQGFRNLTLFDPDEESRLYLERELGLERANQLMQSEVPVWKWRARWFRPPQKDEMRVWLRPDGRLTAFEHRILETESGPRLDKIAARLLAEAFLQGQTSLPHKLVAEQSEARPNREDHLFTWEQEGFRAGEATIRRTVVIQGDKVGRYEEFLHVPEQWQRDFQRLRSSNELYAGIANGLYVLLMLAAAFVLLERVRAHLVPWRVTLAISATVAFFYLLNELNTLPFAIDGMKTSSSLGEMVILALLSGIGSSAGVLIYVMAPAAAAATRDFTRRFSRRGLASRSYFRAVVAGFAMAAVHMAFLTAFYLIGNRFGVWSPQEFDYSDVLGTPIPWVYPIAIALMAASAEEFWFRLFAIPFLERILKIRWLAVVIPAFLWGFLHANYPQQPGYIRGIEVGIIGVAAGWMMLRFGIIATLVWHYTIDAFLIGLFLFRSESWLYRIHGSIVALFILAPLLASVVLYRRNGGFLEEVAELPAAVPELEAREPREDDLAPAFTPFLPARYLYAAALVLGVVAMFARTNTFGSFIRVAVTREQAEAAAQAEMRSRKLDPIQWRMVSDFTPNLRPIDAEYLRQQVGVAEANEIIRTRLATAIWRIRFFQPLQSEEFLYYVNQTGGVYRFDHVLEEKAKGAQLNAEEARHIAEHDLLARHRIPIHTWNLVDSQEDKHDFRTDHSFVWEDPQFRAGEARLRIGVEVIGNETCEFRPHLKLPESWVRDYTKTRISSFLLPAFAGAIGVPLFITFLRRLGARDQRFHWRIYTMLAGTGAALALAGQWNEMPAWLTGYSTTTPLDHYYVQLLTSRVSSVVLTFAGIFAVLLAADVFLQMMSPRRRLPGVSVLRALSVAVIAVAGSILIEWLNQHTPGQHADVPLWNLSGMDTIWPALSVFADSYTASVVAVSAAAVLLCGAMVLLNLRSFQITLGVLLVILTLSRTFEVSQLPMNLVAAGLSIALVAFLVMTLATDIVSAALGLFLAFAGEQAYILLQQPAYFLRVNGMALTVLMATAVVAVARRGR